MTDQMPHTECSVCVLTSGGLDSCILVHQMGKMYGHVHPVYVRCGLAWEAAEVRALTRFLRATPTPRLRPLAELTFPVPDLYAAHWSLTGLNVPDGDSPDDAVYLPGRNLLLLAKAGVFCALNDIHAVALGILASNPFPDATPRFFSLMEKTLRIALRHGIRVLRPFAAMTKAEVMRLGRDLPLELTFSCVNPVRHNHCGNCNKCAERQAAFRRAEMEDRTVYARRTRVE